MNKLFFTILLCVHVLGDFYFQTQKMADKKQKQFLWTVFHSLIYAVGSWLLLFLFLPGLKMRYILAFAGAHAAIDIIKYAVCSLLKTRCGIRNSMYDRRNLFLIDQAAHLLTILGIAFWIGKSNITELYREEAELFFHTFDVSETVFLKWIFVLLLIHKPANILIANILSGYRPEKREGSDKKLPDENGTDRNAGRMIGTLERIIMVIFIAIGQYAAVGLVLTAKSIARYDRIAKDQVFAEYYLLGTLLSTICAIAAALIFL